MKLPTQKEVLTSLNRSLSLFSEQTFNYAKTALWTKDSLEQLQQASLLCLKSLHLISLVMITICVAAVYFPLLASNKAIDFVEKRINLTTAKEEEEEGSSEEAFTKDSTNQGVDHIDSTEEVKVQAAIVDNQSDFSVFTFSNVDSSAVISSTTEPLYNSEEPSENTFSAMFEQTKQEGLKV